MAKLIAPLQSFAASGKIGKSLVFFSHLGRNVVRGLVIPANPQTPTQGAQRLLVGSIGKASHAVNTLSEYIIDAKKAVPSGQTWVSYMVKLITELYGAGAIGTAALASAASGHTKSAIFTAQAATLGLTDLTISYADTTTTITAGAQLYLLAVYAMQIRAANPSLFNRAPYTTALASWTSANIVAFVTDASTAA